jgi:hypothetical protein
MHAARQRDEDFARQMSARTQAVNPGFSMGRAWSVGDTKPGARVTRGGVTYAMKNGAFMGVVLCLIFAWVYTPKPEDQWLAYALASDEAAHLRLLLAREGALPASLDSAVLEAAAQRWARALKSMRTTRL